MNHRPAPDWRLPPVFAHRCGGALAPENTLAGLRIAAALGLRAVEFDVMLSADATPWLIHDETLERTTSGAGRVGDTPDRILKTLDAGAGRHSSFSGEPLPTLADAAALCRALGLMANVEIKPSAGCEAETGEVVARQVIALWKDAPLPLLSSFSEVALHAARKVSAHLPLGCLWTSPPLDWLDRFDALHAFSLHCAWDRLDDAVIAAARQRDIPVLCYTVNEAALARTLWARGVSSLFSDRLDVVGRM